MSKTHRRKNLEKEYGKVHGSKINGFYTKRTLIYLKHPYLDYTISKYYDLSANVIREVKSPALKYFYIYENYPEKELKKLKKINHSDNYIPRSKCSKFYIKEANKKFRLRHRNELRKVIKDSSYEPLEVIKPDLSFYI